MPETTTKLIQQCLDRIRAGDEKARHELIGCAFGRLEILARKALRGFPGVRRWEETPDVAQNASLRLHRALRHINPGSTREFFQLASKLIRRELIDLLRHYHGPQGHGALHNSIAGHADPVAGGAAGNSSLDPGKLAAWTEFHECIERLPDEEREVFDLMWYQELTQAEAAQLLGVSERTVKRRWREARIRMREAFGENTLV